eukprot:COSAG05_NODE_3787_length_1836_cov_2.100173_4_plen_100_part_00
MSKCGARGVAVDHLQPELRPELGLGGRRRVRADVLDPGAAVHAVGAKDQAQLSDCQRSPTHPNSQPHSCSARFRFQTTFQCQFTGSNTVSKTIFDRVLY